jgi:hypothetical protein
MAQMIYMVAAIMILASVVLNVNIRMHSTEDRLMFGELAMDMTGVGNEMFEHIAAMEFDPGTISRMAVPTDSLREEANFGSEVCEPDNGYQGCFTVSDFHGRSATRAKQRQRNNVTYDVEYNISGIVVRYVDEDPPHAPANTQTFAKEVTLTISSPLVADANGNPLEITMSRTYMYPMY